MPRALSWLTRYSCAPRSPGLPVLRPSYLSSARTLTLSHHDWPSKCSAAWVTLVTVSRQSKTNTVHIEIPRDMFRWRSAIKGSDFQCVTPRDVSAETLIVRWSDTGVFAVLSYCASAGGASS